MNTAVKFVYCDIGGVLFDEGGTNALLAELHIDPDKFRRARRRYADDSLTGKITANELINNTLSDIGLSRNFENYNDYWTSHSESYPIGQEMLIVIAKHYLVGLLTNNMKGSLPFYEKYGHYPKLNYKAIIQSSELGIKKPDKEIYVFSERETGVNNKSILFIDDRKDNLKEPRKLGWQTFFYEANNQKKSSKKLLEYLEIDL